MNYYKRMQVSKLEKWYIAKQLGLKLNTLTDFINGRRAFAGESLEKFMALTEPNKKEWINQETEWKEINKWFNTISIKDLENLLVDFKINQKDLAKEIGCDASSINNVIHKKIERTGKNVVAFIYYFFKDENNRRHEWKIVKRGRKKSKPKEEIVPTKELKFEDFRPKNEEVAREITVEDEAVDHGAVDQGEDEKFDDNRLWHDLCRQAIEKYKETKAELDRLKYLIDLARKDSND